MIQRDLFSSIGQTFARGFAYEPEFLSRADEESLLREIERLPLSQAEYKGFLAKRRIVSYGGRYDFSSQRLQPSEPIPPFLYPLRAQAAAWAGCSADDLTHALIAQYPAGSQLGWHRDVPDFELVTGISLLGRCRLRFRRYPPGFRERSIAFEIEPRSIYRLLSSIWCSIWTITSYVSIIKRSAFHPLVRTSTLSSEVREGWRALDKYLSPTIPVSVTRRSTRTLA